MFYSHPLLIFIVFIFSTLSCLSQHVSFRVYSVSEGLGASSVNHVNQDDNGYMWISTQGGGLCRFDGSDFKNYTVADGLPANDVTYSLVTRNGVLWACTSGGVSSFDGERFVNYGSKAGLTDGIVYCAAEDHDNNLYFTTADKGLAILSGEKFQYIDTSAGLISNEAFTVTVDSNVLWIGVNGGICKYQNRIVTSLYSHPLVRGKAFFSSYLDTKGIKWFGSTTGELIRIDKNGKITGVNLPEKAKGAFIGGICEDRLGNLWIATDRGLLKYDRASFSLYTTQEGLSTNTVQSVMCDYEGHVWCGTLLGGVNVLLNELFVHYTVRNGLADNNVTAICKGFEDGEYFIGTSSGISLFNNYTKRIKKINISHSKKTLNVTSITTKDGQLWVTTPDGLYILVHRQNGYLVNQYVSNVKGEAIVSPVNTIHTEQFSLIPTFGSGLLMCKSDESGELTFSSVLPGHKLLNAYVDHKSNVWLCSIDSGLLLYRNGGVVAKGPLMKMSVWSISELSDSILLLNAGSVGLIVYNTRTDSFLSYKLGKGVNYSSLMLDKNSKAIWAGTESGMERLTFDNSFTLKSDKFFDKSNGFTSAAINPNSLQLSDTDKLIIGAVDGLWEYDYSNDHKICNAFKLDITDIQLPENGKVELLKTSCIHPAISSVQLRHDENNMSITIQALTISEVTYSYKIDGIDKGWSKSLPGNQIAISSIPPGGRYILRAKAVNRYGVESQELSIPIYVTAPWWYNDYAKLFMVILLIVVVVAISYIREKVLVNEKLKLESIVAARTAEIENQKNTILGILNTKEVLLTEKELLLNELHHRVKNNLQVISSILMLQSRQQTSYEIKDALNEIQSRIQSIAALHSKLQYSNSINIVDLSPFVEEIVHQVKLLYSNKQQNVEIDISITEVQVPVDKAVSIGLIINELVVNSFKHAFLNKKSGILRIAVTREAFDGEEVITVRYADNGDNLQDNGFKTDGLGLKLIHLLGDQLSAKILFETTSSFSFTMKLPL